jgi:DNA polymerase (family 10)
MNNAKIAAAFDEVADLLEFKNANPFRVRAYRKVAQTIRDLPEPVSAIVADPDRSLTDIEGIGQDLADKCVTLLETDRLPLLDELLADTPKSVLELLRVPGLGPRKAAAVYESLGVTNLEQLRNACESHAIRELKGFGAKTEQAILNGLAIASAAGQRLLWAEADAIAQSLQERLKACTAVKQIAVAGSYRRGKETVGDLDVLVTADDVEAVMDCFAGFPDIASVTARGDTKMAVRLDNGFQMDLRVVPEESFGAALQYFTGSKDHNVELRGRAKQKGLKINEYGVFRAKTDKYVAGRTEEDVYATLGLPLFPPELREGRQEFEWAGQGKLPELIELRDIRGDLHMHTTATDGTATIEEMVVAAKQRGLKYIAITDHSRRVSMARGLDPKRVLKQWKEIDKLNQRQEDAFVILKGIECDILEQGGMDLPDDVLAQADWVLASVHYGQRQPLQKITDRILGAIENPYVCAIAHPTGRLLNKREAYEIDLDAVLRAAHEHGKLLELNANPWRLDLNDVHCAAAKRLGIPIVISTDAHSPEGLGMMRYGVQQARRAALAKQDVANTRTWNQLLRLIGKKRSGSQ